MSNDNTRQIHDFVFAQQLKRNLLHKPVDDIWIYAFKFTDEAGQTYRDGIPFAYNTAPVYPGGWSEWTCHPQPSLRDGLACGPGRLHLMREMSSKYAPAKAVAWRARFKIRDIVGVDSEKIAVTRLQLQGLPIAIISRLLRIYHKTAYMYQADLSAIDFSGVDLQNSYFSAAYLSGVDFIETNLSGAVLSRAIMPDSKWRLSNAHKTMLDGVNMNRARFVSSNLSGAQINSASLKETVFYSCDLSGVNLSRAILDATRFCNSNLARATIDRALCRRTVFDESDLTGASLTNTTFDGVSFRGANLTGVDFSGSTFALTAFTDAIFSNTKMSLRNAHLLSRGQRKGVIV